jgi:hypothetical protein
VNATTETTSPLWNVALISVYIVVYTVPVFIAWVKLKQFEKRKEEDEEW